MKVLAIKQEMHQAIDLIEDTNFLKAVNVIFNEKSKKYVYDFNEEEKNS